MAVSAITAAVNRDTYGPSERIIIAYGMDASAGTIPKGAFVCLDDSGYAVNGADTGDYTFVGIAIETKTFSGSSDGDTEIRVDATPGAIWKFGHNTGDLAKGTDDGTVMYLENNNAVDDATAATKDIRVGTIASVIDADECWLRVDFVDPRGDA